MPQPRKWADRAKRQAAYRERQRAVQTQLLRRKGLPALPAVPQIPGTARWKAAAQTSCTLLQTVVDEMHDYFDERSEAWQEGDKAEAFQERIEALEEIVSLLECLE